MGIFRDFNGNEERLFEANRGYADRAAASRDARDMARRSAKILRDLCFTPISLESPRKKPVLYIRENGVCVYRAEPDLAGYGIYDVQNGDRCVGGITGYNIRLEGGVSFSFASYIPEFGWFIECPTMFLTIYDKNDRFIGEAGPKNYPSRTECYIHICKSRVDLRVVALAIANEERMRLIAAASRGDE